MKKLLIYLYIGAISIFLAVAHTSWQERTSHASPQLAEISVKKEEVSPTESLMKNWPAAAKEAYAEAQKQGRPLKLAIVGSPSLGTKTNGWSVQLKKQLEEAYKGTVAVQLYEFDLTSQQFVQSKAYEPVVAWKPDVVLYETLLLKDNGVVAPNDHLGYTKQVMAAVKQGNPKATFILQPAHPLPGSVHYPKQEETLQQFAARNKIAYIDHWQAWPDLKGEEIEVYVTGDQSAPTEKGHAVWAKFLSSYFIAK